VAVFAPAAIPAVVFTDPEIAWAGLTEAEAEKQGRTVEVAKFPWPASGRAIAIDRTDGMTKMIIDPETERVLADSSVIGAVHPPNTTALMDLYADAFEKVWANLQALL